ncbi:MAG: hypothetical protein GF307_03800 [candidate division Zixibacteria bacterium]|nr:hypothetical protein [candidate division Zixibacteria bacterium]
MDNQRQQTEPILGAYVRERKWGEHQPRRIQPKHIWGLLFVIATFVLALATLILPGAIVIAVVLSIVSAIAVLKYPIIGLSAFVILNFIRPGDFVPGLDAIPLAKMIGGGTLLAVILQHLRSKDILFRYRQTYLLIAFTIVLFISAPLSYWPSRAMEVSMDFLKIMLFFLIFINIIRDYKRLQAVSLIALLSILVLCYSTIQSYFSGADRAAATIGAGIFGDSNDVALVFVTAIPLSEYFRVSRLKPPLNQLLYWASVAFLSFGVFATQSRGGFLGLCAVLFILFTRGRNKVKGLLVLAVVGLVIFALLPGEMTERYSTIDDYQEDASAMGRIHAWKAGIKMMLSRPLNGVGIGCFEVAFGTAYRPPGFTSSRWMSPHNTLIQVGGETGLIGLAIFLYLYIYCILQMRRLEPEGSPEDKTKILSARDITLASLVGFGVCAFFLTQALNYMYYFLVASTVCIVNINSTNKEKADILYSGPEVKTAVVK